MDALESHVEVEQVSRLCVVSGGTGGALGVIGDVPGLAREEGPRYAAVRAVVAHGSGRGDAPTGGDLCNGDVFQVGVFLPVSAK